MKIIHTSDWHLGQTFYDYDRSAEHNDMLQQIIDIVRDVQPHALVVSGDIFHTSNPTPKAIAMYNHAMIQMHEACPTMEIIVTAGNHDSASRLVVNNALWDYFHVRVIGNTARRADECRTPDYDAHIIAINDSDGSVIGYVAAVPHCYESNFPCSNPELQREDRAKAYFQGLLDAVAERNHDNAPVVLMAHIAVDGSDLSGHDCIGGMETRDVSIFGIGYDYVALGHIHSPQNITSRIRYCGTPIPVNFGEKHEHSISIVDVEKGAEPVIECRRIKNLIPMHDFPAQPEPLDTVLQQLAEYPDHPCYLRILIKADEKNDALAETLISKALEEKECRFCKVQRFYDKRDDQSSAQRPKLSSGQLKEKSPLEIAEMFFALNGIEITETQRQMITAATIQAEKIRKGDTDEA